MIWCTSRQSREKEGFLASDKCGDAVEVWPLPLHSVIQWKWTQQVLSSEGMCVNGVQISVTHPDLQHSMHVVATGSYYGYLVFGVNGPL